MWGKFVEVTDDGDSCVRNINIRGYSVEKIGHES